MKQEYPLGSLVTVEVFTLNPLEPQEIEERNGVIVGYCAEGYLPKRLGIKRYKIELDDTSIIFMGASRIKLRKE